MFSLISVITGAVMPLAMVFFGPLADYVKIEYILIVTGLLFIAGSFFLVRDKVFQNWCARAEYPLRNSRRSPRHRNRVWNKYRRREEARGMTDFFSGKAGLSESLYFPRPLASLLPAAVFFRPCVSEYGTNFLAAALMRKNE